MCQPGSRYTLDLTCIGWTASAPAGQWIHTASNLHWLDSRRANQKADTCWIYSAPAGQPTRQLDSGYSPDLTCISSVATGQQLVSARLPVHTGSNLYQSDSGCISQTADTHLIYLASARQGIPARSNWHQPVSWYMLDLTCISQTGNTRLI